MTTLYHIEDSARIRLEDKETGSFLWEGPWHVFLEDNEFSRREADAMGQDLAARGACVYTGHAGLAFLITLVRG